MILFARTFTCFPACHAGYTCCVTLKVIPSWYESTLWAPADDWQWTCMKKRLPECILSQHSYATPSTHVHTVCGNGNTMIIDRYVSRYLAWHTNFDTRLYMTGPRHCVTFGYAKKHAWYMPQLRRNNVQDLFFILRHRPFPCRLRCCALRAIWTSLALSCASVLVRSESTFNHVEPYENTGEYTGIPALYIELSRRRHGEKQTKDSNVRSRSKRRPMMQPSREGRNRLRENCVCRKVRMFLICSVVVRKLSDRTPTRGACRHGRNQPWRHWNTQSYRQGNIHAIWGHHDAKLWNIRVRLKLPPVTKSTATGRCQTPRVHYQYVLRLWGSMQSRVYVTPS